MTSGPTSPRHFKIFVSSPGDVGEERQAAFEILQQIPREPAWKNRVTITPVSWDDPHAGLPMDAALPPQQSVERRDPPSGCDLTIVILWGRMGAPLVAPRRTDGSQYSSGTEREFEEARDANKPVLLYRRLPQPAIDIDDPDREEKGRQRTLVNAFFDRLKNADGSLQGGFHTYQNVSKFRILLKQHVEGRLRELLEERRGEPQGRPKKTSGPAAEPTIPKDYLDWLKDRCGSVELLGPRLKHGQAVRLNNVYVPLATTGRLVAARDYAFTVQRSKRAFCWIA